MPRFAGRFERSTIIGRLFAAEREDSNSGQINHITDLIHEGEPLKVAIFLFAVVLIAAPAFGQAVIQGRVTDKTGATLPGVDVTVSGTNYRRAVTTDASGGYQVTGLPTGTYSVQAALQGFCTATREGVLLEPARTVEVNFNLGIAAVENPLWVTLGVRDSWRVADAVAHVRVSAVLGTRPWPEIGCGSITCTQYRVSILSLVKRHQDAGPSGAAFTFLQDYAAVPGNPPYANGDEFIAFLTWRNSWGAFLRMTMLPVRNGRVSAASPGDDEWNGLKIEDFVARLRALAK